MRTTGRARRGTRATTACRWRQRVVPRDAGHRGQRVLSRLSGRERGTFASRLVQFAITRVAVPRRANGPDPEPPLGVHEHESSGDRREHPLCRRSRVRWDWTPGVQGGQDARQARAAPAARRLDRFTFLLGGSDGERLFGPRSASRAGWAPVPGSGQPPRRESHRGLRAHLSGWTGRRIRLLLSAAVVRVAGSAPRGRISSLVFPMVTGKPATVPCLASGCAAGLPATGAIG